MPPPIRTLRSIGMFPDNTHLPIIYPIVSPQKREQSRRPKPFMRISGARRPRRDSRRRASPSSTKAWPTRLASLMGLAVSVRGVNGFRLSRKRMHDSGDLRTKIAWRSRKASRHKSRCRLMARDRPAALPPQLCQESEGHRTRRKVLRIRLRLGMGVLLLMQPQPSVARWRGRSTPDHPISGLRLLWCSN